MKLTTTNFTIAEYYDQMKTGRIRVNHDYQRSPRVWPPAAKSYLIDTILLGYPIPKLSLYQKTNLRSRTTVKEIVDGQQRSQTIRDFFDNKIRITGKSAFSGMSYEQLDDGLRRRFVSYSLSADIFVEASDEEVRQVFRRINSYTVPLNPQEKRHATFQGAFKWFIVGLCEKYSEVLKSIGVFTEKHLSRMHDAKLLTELCDAFTNGIHNASEVRLDKFYKDREGSFAEQDSVEWQISRGIDQIIRWESIHHGPLMKSYNFFTLCLATSHRRVSCDALSRYHQSEAPHPLDEQIVAPNLSMLADAIEDPRRYPSLTSFVDACAKATTRIRQREARFDSFCKALGRELLQ